MGRPALLCLLSVVRRSRLRSAFGRHSVGREDVSTRASVRVQFGQDRGGAESGIRYPRGRARPSLRPSANRCIKRACEVRDGVAGESHARA